MSGNHVERCSMFFQDTREDDTMHIADELDCSNQAFSSFQFDDIVSPIFSLNCSGVITEWNFAVSCLTGFERSDRIHRSYTDLFAPLHLDHFQNSLREASSALNVTSKKSFGTSCCDVYLLSKDGKLIPVRIKISALLASSSLSSPSTSFLEPANSIIIAGAVCFVEEDISVKDLYITDRCSPANNLKKLNGQTVQTSENSNLREDEMCASHPPESLLPSNSSLAIIDPASLCIPVFAVDSEMHVCVWNQALSELTGYQLNDFIQDNSGTFLFSLFDCGTDVHSAFEKSLSGSGESQLNLKMRVKGGCHLLRIKLSTAVQHMHMQYNDSFANSPVGLIAFVQESPFPTQTNTNPEASRSIFQDVDTNCISDLNLQQQQQLKQKHPEEHHYQKEEELTEDLKFMDQVNMPIIAVNRQGIVDMWNPEAEQLFGWDASEVLERDNLWDLCTRGSGGIDDEIGALTKDVISLFTPGADMTEAAVIDTFDSARCLSPIDATRQSIRKVTESACLSGIATSQFELEIRTKSNAIHYLLANIFPRRAAGNQNGQMISKITGAFVVAQDVTEVAQHDRAVAAMAHELQQLIDTASAPIFGVDCAGHVNEWNNKTAETFGYSGDEAFNKPFVETFVSSRDQVAAYKVVQNALKGENTINYELEICTKSHELRFLLINATTRRNVDNEIVGVIVLAQDITEAAKHDRAIAAMASELRQLIDTANAPIFGIDCDGDVNEWNNKAAEITGYTKEEAFDCSLVDTFIVPDMQDSAQIILENALQGRGTSNYELEFRTKSTEIRHLLINATTRRDAENIIVGAVVVAQDITEAVQREKAVAGMALELRQLIDTANAPIFGIDIDGNINEWNHRTQEITGYSKEETFDESLVNRFIAPSMRSKVQDVLDNALHGNATSNYELEFLSKSGESRFMLVNVTTRRDPEFNVVGVLGVAQDMTEDRKHAEELRKMQYLQATQVAKVETERNMTAYFAHELRNPLGAIDSALNAMPDNLPKSAKSLVLGMQLCSSFMSSIMNNLLDVRKMEEGKMTLNVVPLSLSNVLDRVHKMLMPSVKPGVGFKKEVFTDGKDWVLGDEHRIQQVLTNVITNAIKYTLSGSITTRISWADKFVRFECEDTGPGIPKSKQEKLFERFVQRGGAPGTGLGLAIAKHLVELANGTIRFDSDPAVKTGTTCIVELPLALCICPKIEEESDISMIEEACSFLIIDDIKINRTMLKRRIKMGIAPKCSIREACTGEEALEICSQESFDVVIVDQYMENSGGVMVGTDVVYAMRRRHVSSIIIGCSGNDLDEEFREAGADWVWQKPMPSNSDIILQLRTALASKGGE